MKKTSPSMWDLLVRYCAKSSKEPRERHYRPRIELLEDRTVPAPFTLTTGPGDGGVSVGVDGFGAFGFVVGADQADAIFDPIGSDVNQQTSFESGVAIRIGGAGARSFLTSGTIGGSGSLPNPAVSGSSTTATSNFTSGVLGFNLVQTIAPTFLGSTRTGSMLTQTYTITNTGGAAVNFELVRYFDGWYYGGLNDRGGRVPSPTEILYEVDNINQAISVGITGLGGTIPASDRFEINSFPGLRTRLLAGNSLGDLVFNDTNADGQIDIAYDVTMALRNTFSLAPSASTTYITHSIFGSPGTTPTGGNGTTSGEGSFATGGTGGEGYYANSGNYGAGGSEGSYSGGGRSATGPDESGVGMMSLTEPATTDIGQVHVPPLAADDYVSWDPAANALAILAADLLGNDCASNGAALRIIDFTQPANGSLSFDGQVFLYTPRAGYSGVDAFVYAITDGQGGLNKAVVTIGRDSCDLSAGLVAGDLLIINDISNPFRIITETSAPVVSLPSCTEDDCQGKDSFRAVLDENAADASLQDAGVVELVFQMTWEEDELFAWPS